MQVADIEECAHEAILPRNSRGRGKKGELVTPHVRWFAYSGLFAQTA
jgi:hypothetical protein